MAVIGPAPLLRHDASGGLQIQEEGLTVLRRVGAPLHVVFTIGGSRCGKSTVCNALLHGQDAVGRQGFQTGSSFDPVTHGVDVAAKKLPGGGSLVLADCEGAFHICGSTMSARGFGSVGLLAYHLSSVVVHVTMGSIDERDIEALGHLAATAPETEPPNGSPELLLLVNGARFELGDAVARRLLQPQPGAGRTCARGAIAAAFRERPALEALPCCEHDAYWPKVEELRRRILSVPAVAQGMGKASGSQLAERLERLVAAMSGNTGPATDPVSAAEQAMRSLHLDPLVEEIAKKFTAAASSVREETGSPSSPGSQCDQDALAVEEALAEFDLRSAWLEGDVLPKEVLGAVRQRLRARLEGIAEAVQRGRRESRRLRQAARFKGTPSKLERSLLSEDLRTPTPPQTPSRRRTLAALLGGVETTALRAEALHSSATQQMAQLRAALGKLSQAQALGTESDTDQVTPWQESWQRRLQDLGRRPLSTWHTAGQELVDEIARELREIEGRMPDVVSGAVMLEEARGEVEALRLSRRQALEKTQRRLEQRVEELRQECAQAVGGHAELRERVSRQLSLRMAGLQQTLTDEALHRRERHQALVEVVAQMSKSLEASMLSEEQDTMDTLTPSPAQPQKTTPGSRWKSEKTWAVRRRL